MTMEAEFWIEAMQNALAKHDAPKICTADRQKMDIGF